VRNHRQKGRRATALRIPDRATTARAGACNGARRSLAARSTLIAAATQERTTFRADLRLTATCTICHFEFSLGATNTGVGHSPHIVGREITARVELFFVEIGRIFS
jgi:hypothetical protein